LRLIRLVTFEQDNSVLVKQSKERGGFIPVEFACRKGFVHFLKCDRAGSATAGEHRLRFWEREPLAHVQLWLGSRFEQRFDGFAGARGARESVGRESRCGVNAHRGVKCRREVFE
jgi:hypothetical protein